MEEHNIVPNADVCNNPVLPRMGKNSCVQLGSPRVVEKLKPKVGQEFESIPAAYNFYNAYARIVGFSIRNSSSRKNPKTNERLWKQFVCYKEGKRDDRYEKKKAMAMSLNNDGDGRSVQPTRRRGHVRVGCRAKLTIVKRQSTTNWVVSTFEEQHNHEFTTPRKVHLLPSQRKVTKVRKCLMKDLREANVPASQQMRIFEIQSGGIENVGCTQRDLLNHERDLRKEMKGHDAENLHEFFKLEKEKNSSFYFEIDCDEEDRMTRCFWADATARRSYNFFGDVVVFNTTYNTNKYGMIFVPFVGVNHHKQTIIFGCGLLSDEKIESFVWLFKQWLNAMPQGPPKLIITDQDPAMKKAIDEVLPHTAHRFCIWHIMTKFQEKLGPVNHKAYGNLFFESVYDSETEQEFERSWNVALQKSSLENHIWLQSMYDIRDTWVPAYGKHIFSAGMSSSQRSESQHAFFKRHVLPTNSLMDFITRFNRALGHQRHQELVCNHIDINEKPKVNTPCPMEKQMVDVYTRKIFLKFQQQIWESFTYVIRQMDDENQISYKVVKFDDEKSKIREVVYDSTSDFVKCSCCYFEVKGIPCKHMIVVLRHRQIFYLPSQYILPRWTKSARVGRVCDDDGVELKEVIDNPFMMRRSNLFHIFSVLADDASLSEEGTALLKNSMEKVHNEIKELNRSQCVEGGIVDGGTEKAKKDFKKRTINEPQQVRAKGCGKRLKASREKTTKKDRVCHGCGKSGQSHDKRNCPELMILSNINEDGLGEVRQSDHQIDPAVDFVLQSN